MLDMRKLWNKVTDLRRSITAAIKVKPSDSKHKDFNLALAEYLYKELKSEGIPVSKHDACLKVALNKPHLDKYDNIVIDCVAGKLYLRGKNTSDRYFGRLRRFEGGTRAADAYHCASQSSVRIVNRIKNILESAVDMEVFGGLESEEVHLERLDARRRNVLMISANKVDMRKTAQRVDMRKTASVKPVDMRKQKQVIEIRDHRTTIAWLNNGKVVASGHDDRIKKVVERVDMRKLK